MPVAPVQVPVAVAAVQAPVAVHRKEGRTAPPSVPRALEPEPALGQLEAWGLQERERRPGRAEHLANNSEALRRAGAQSGAGAQGGVAPKRTLLHSGCIHGVARASSSAKLAVRETPCPSTALSRRTFVRAG